MKEDLKPSYFFDLSHFSHAALFDPNDYVWKALEHLERYLNSMSLGDIKVDIPAGVYLENQQKISIGAGTVIEPGVYIQGPCVIGSQCTLRQGAYIRGNVLAGNKCVIGHDTEVKNSILFDGAQAAHFAYLGDSIIGNRVNLGAGTKCANLKLDHSLITIVHEELHIKTGLRKLGAIIGDDSQIGCNSVTNPGTFLGKRVLSYPLLSLKGFIPSHSLVKSHVQLVVEPLVTGH